MGQEVPQHPLECDAPGVGRHTRCQVSHGDDYYDDDYYNDDIIIMMMMMIIIIMMI